MIADFTPLSTIDWPGHIASVIWTQGCNFRCPYCHNPELLDFVEGEYINHGIYDIRDKKVLEKLIANKKNINRVVITGGEPTLWVDRLAPLIEDLKKSCFKIKLDTNGYSRFALKIFLERELVDFVSMDIKAPWGKYNLVNPWDLHYFIPPNLTLKMLRHYNIPYQLRTTVWPGLTEEDLAEIRSYLTPEELENYVVTQAREVKK